MLDKWDWFIIHGGDMPDVTENWPEAPMPETGCDHDWAHELVLVGGLDLDRDYCRRCGEEWL
jgi:hypothetical protein